MEAIKKNVVRSKIAFLFDIPESYGEEVEVIILPGNTQEGSEISRNKSVEMMRLQEKGGFVQTVLGDEAEDVWNEI